MANVPDRPSGLGLQTGDERDEWWPGQRTTIQQIVDAYATGKRFVLANMPQGSGKTIVGAAVQRMLAVSSLSLVHTIQLQHQYTRTMPWAAVVTGRGNHACELPGFLTAKGAICEHGMDCEFIRPDGCSYYRMLFNAAANESAVTNYAYATRIIQLGGLKWAKRPDSGRVYNPFHRGLLICDEGHLIEGSLVDSARVVVRHDHWEEVGERPPDSQDAGKWQEWAEGALKAAEAARDGLQRGEFANDGEFYKRLARYQAMVRVAETVGGITKSSEWIVSQGEKETLLRPLWGWTVAESLLWHPFSRVLVMSATLGDPTLLCRSLAIPDDQYAYIDVPSTFPIENRLVYYWPVVRLNRNSTPADYERLASCISMLANHGSLANQKGVVHAGSFKVARQLRERLAGGRYIFHESQEANRALAEFERSDEPRILVTPSFTTGLDLPYTIGWQVIAKMPFGDLGDPIVKARRETRIEGVEFGKRNYDADAMNTVVQAVGRAVRAPDDRGVNYVLDGNFWPLYKRAYTPSFFREAVRWLRV